MSGINNGFHSEYKYIWKEFKNILYRKGEVPKIQKPRPILSLFPSQLCSLILMTTVPNPVSFYELISKAYLLRKQNKSYIKEPIKLISHHKYLKLENSWPLLLTF